MRASPAIGLFTFAVLCAAGARAQEAGPPRELDLALAADPASADALRTLIEELLAGLDVGVRARVVDTIDPRDVVSPPPSPQPAIARVWIGIEPPSAILYLADASWERVLVRRVPVATLDVAAREQLAQIVVTAIEALLGGATIGLSRAEAQAELVPEEPATPPQPTTSPAREPTPIEEPEISLGVEVWLGGGLPIWSDGPRAGAAVLARFALFPSVRGVRPITILEARVRPPQTAQSDDVELHLWSATARIEGGADVAIDSDTSVRATVGLALDVTSVDPRPRTARVAPTPARDDVTALITFAAGVTRRLAAFIWASAGLSLDVDLVDTRYVVLAGSTEVVVLDPWSVRPWPWLALGGRL